MRYKLEGGIWNFSLALSFYQEIGLYSAWVWMDKYHTDNFLSTPSIKESIKTHTQIKDQSQLETSLWQHIDILLLHSIKWQQICW